MNPPLSAVAPVSRSPLFFLDTHLDVSSAAPGILRLTFS